MRTTDLTKTMPDPTAFQTREEKSAAAWLDSPEPPSECLEPELSANALAVLERRYLKKDPATGRVIETPRQILWRVASAIARVETRQPGGSAEQALAIALEFYDLMARRKFMPNSPTLMNAATVTVCRCGSATVVTRSPLPRVVVVTAGSTGVGTARGIPHPVAMCGPEARVDGAGPPAYHRGNVQEDRHRRGR